MLRVSPRQAIAEKNKSTSTYIKSIIAEKNEIATVTASLAVAVCDSKDYVVDDSEKKKIISSYDAKRLVSNFIDSYTDTKRNVFDANSFYYENAGYREKFAGNIHKLDVTNIQSNTGVACGNGEGYINIPNQKELWIRFDLNFLCNDYNKCSISVYETSNKISTGFNIYKNKIQAIIDETTVNTISLNHDGLHKYLIHIKAGDNTSSVLQIFDEKGLIYECTNKNINQNLPFDILYFLLDNNIFMSNIIVSSNELCIYDNAKIDFNHVSFPYLKSNNTVCKDNFAIIRSDNNKNIYEIFNPDVYKPNYGLKKGIVIYLKRKMQIHAVNVKLHTRATMNISILGSNDNIDYKLLQTVKLHNDLCKSFNDIQQYNYYKLTTNDEQSGIDYITIDATYIYDDDKCNFEYDSKRTVNGFDAIAYDTRLYTVNDEKDFRYENLGYAEGLNNVQQYELDITKSSTGIGLLQHDKENIDFLGLPKSNELWIRFDLYRHDIEKRYEKDFYFLSEKTGIKFDGDECIEILINNKDVYDVALSDLNIGLENFFGLHKYLLHIVKNDDNTVVQFWYEDKLIADYQGDRIQDDYLSNVYFYSETSDADDEQELAKEFDDDNYVSNIIVSNKELSIHENARKREFNIAFITSRKTCNIVNDKFDTYLKYTADNSELVTLNNRTNRTVYYSIDIGAKTERIKINSYDVNFKANREIQDVELKNFRYENAGYIEKTFCPGHTVKCDSTKSNTGVGFTSKLKNTKMFPIEPCEQLWIRFDMYLSDEGYIKFGTFNENIDYDMSIWNYMLFTAHDRLSTDQAYSIYTEIGCAGHSETIDDKPNPNVGLHSCLIYISRSSIIDYDRPGQNGSFKVYLDGELYVECNDNINNGQLFNAIYIQCSSEKNLISNLIISNKELTFDDKVSVLPNQFLVPDINHDGGIGENEFACVYSEQSSSYFVKKQAYELFSFDSDNTSSYFDMLANNFVVFYTEKAVKLKKLYFSFPDEFKECFKNYWNTNAFTKSLTLSYSDDGKTFDKICDFETDGINKLVVNLPIDLQAHKYFKLYANDNLKINHMNIDAVTLDTVSIDVNFDTQRNTFSVVDVSNIYDTKLVIQNDTNSYYDTYRNTLLTNIQLFNYDTQRNTFKCINVKSDTLKSIAYCLNNIQIQSINLTLSENTLSDNLQINLVGEVFPLDTIVGNIYDYKYKMLVEKTSQSDSVQSIHAMYYIDNLLRTPRKITTVYNEKISKKTESGSIIKDNALKWSAEAVAFSIAENLGLVANVLFSNFLPDNGYNDVSMKYQSLLANVFGWSNSLPWRAINIFIRDNELYFLQRGYEQNIVNIDELKTTRPHVERAVYRSEYDISDLDTTNSQDKSNNSKNGNSESSSVEIHYPDGSKATDEPYNYEPLQPQYFNGVVQCGNTSLLYNEGLCVSKTVFAKTNDGTVEYNASMDYDSKRRLIYKVEQSNNVKTVTSIAWDNGSNVGANTTTETRYVVDEESGTSADSIITQIVTVSEDLGNGFVGVSTYVDGVYQGSSISGSGTSTPSQYTTNERNKNGNGDNQKYEYPRNKNINLPKSYKVLENEGNGTGISQAVMNSDIPKNDKSLLDKYQNEIREYDGKIQETISLSVVSPVINGQAEYKHIIDFTDKILYKGELYYLQTNNVSLNPTEFIQNLTFTRWY